MNLNNHTFCKFRRTSYPCCSYHDTGATKNFFSTTDWMLFSFCCSHTSCFFPVRFHWSSPFCLVALLYNLTEIVPPSLQSLQVHGDVWGCARWVGQEKWGVHFPVSVGSGFQWYLWLTRETKKDATEWYFYTFLLILSVQFKGFCSLYQLWT